MNGELSDNDPWSGIVGMPADLLTVRRLVFEPCGLAFSTPLRDTDNAEYGGFSLQVAGRTVAYRVGKLTPTKNGLFVTVWRRAGDGSTRPFERSDGIDVVAITVREGANFGQFVFPWPILEERGIVSARGREGKRGFRIYPPWVAAGSRQAALTQAWQAEHFLSIDTGVDLDRAGWLYAGAGAANAGRIARP